MGLEQSPEASLACPDRGRLLEIDEACPEPLDRLLVLDRTDRERPEQGQDRDIVLDEERPAIEERVEHDRFAVRLERDRHDRPAARGPGGLVTVHIRIGMDDRVVSSRDRSPVQITDDDGACAEDRLGGDLESIPERRRRLGAGPGRHHGTGEVEGHGAMDKPGQPPRRKECGEVREPGQERETSTDERDGAVRGAIRRGRTEAGDDDGESEHRRPDPGQEEAHARQSEAPARQPDELGGGQCLADPEVEDEEKDRRNVSRAEDQDRQRRHHEPAEGERPRLHRDRRDACRSTGR